MSQFPFQSKPPGPLPHGLSPRRRSPTPPSDDSQFKSLRASLLYCPTCQTATPTRERLLLVLPSGNLYDYYCAQCGTSTGEKTDQDKSDPQLFIP